MSMTAKQINLKSHTLARAVGGLNEKIHQHALVIMKHIEEHGDVTVADVLCNALGKNNMRVNPLRQWFVTYCGLAWNAEKEAFRKDKKRHEDGFTFDHEQASSEPFWLLMPEEKFKPIDGKALLRAALSKMKKALADEEHKDEHDVDPVLVAKLEELLK